MTTLVIYHANCADGFCCAWLFNRTFPGAEFHAAQHGAPPPDVRGKRVYVADFSYPRSVLADMCRDAIHVTVLDHHRTAQEDLNSVVEELASVVPVPLSDGTFAYVDAADQHLISDYAWSRAKHGGVTAYAGGGRENQQSVYMHRLITNAPNGVLVDHRNRVTCDNRRSNLRFATRQQNAANMDRGSEWKGVTKHGEDSWRAQITVSGKNRYLGSFPSAEEAARAYDQAARDAFGEFARCNFGESAEPFPANCAINFDTTKSGGRLVWEFLAMNRLLPPDLAGYAHDRAHWLVNYTEDRDLWRWELPQSREVNAALRSFPLSFDAWDVLAKTVPGTRGWGGLVSQGEAILRAESQTVAAHVRNAREVEIDGHRVLAVNATTLVSEVAGELAKGRPFGACYFDRADGVRVWSLRERDSGVDVSAIAKRHGGGGHKSAAGFQEPIPALAVRDVGEGAAKAA